MSVDVLLYAHEAMRSHVRLVRRSTAGPDPRILDLWNSETKLSFNVAETSLKRALNGLDEDLRQHFLFEEEVLPALIGELLMESIISEHQKISREMNSILSRLRPGRPRNSSPTGESLNKRINDFIDLLLEHWETEDAILKLLRKNPTPKILVQSQYE